MSIDIPPLFDEWLSKQTFSEANPLIQMGHKEDCTCGSCYNSAIVQWMFHAFYAGYAIRGEIDKANGMTFAQNIYRAMGLTQ